MTRSRPYNAAVTNESLRQKISRLAAEIGFDRVGVARAEPLERGAYVREWVESGRAGRMAYLERHLDVRLDPRRLLAGARSIIVAALNYHRPEPPRPAHGAPGRVAMYAWGRDYHRLMKKMLWRFVEALRAETGESFPARVCVDTAPLIEREAAAAAGIGWIGKNTMVLSRELGSYFFLGEVITTLEIAADEPMADRCGSCTRCLEACPTQAFPAPYEMDATRCISYLTIELREEVPSALAAGVGDWVYGCDICQQVCPYNQRAPETANPALCDDRAGAWLDLRELLHWTDDDYAERLRGSAMKRATLDMLRRNARIVLEQVVASKSPAHAARPEAAEEERGPVF